MKYIFYFMGLIFLLACDAKPIDYSKHTRKSSYVGSSSTQTISARVAEPLLEKLRLPLNKSYNFRKVPINSLSYVILRAILLKIKRVRGNCR